MSSPLLFSAAPQPFEDNFIQRNDSEATDESPFGSSLTTPVDEDMQIFPGITERLLAAKDDGVFHNGPASLQQAAYPGTIKKNAVDPGTPTQRPRSLSRAALKAKQFARGIVNTSKMLALEPLVSSKPPSPPKKASCAPSSPVKLDSPTSSSPLGQTPVPPGPLQLRPLVPFDPLEDLPLKNRLSLQPSTEAPSVDTEYTPHIRQRERANSIYSLPNEPIHTSESENSVVASDKNLQFVGEVKPLPAVPNAELGSHDTEVAGQPETTSEPEEFVAGPSIEEDVQLESPASTGVSNPLSFFIQTPENLQALLSTIIKLVCFIPWCAAVGGAILLSPRDLELVAFSPGYITSPRGIHRYAYWAECGIPHVMIFLAFFAAFAWYIPTAGSLAVGGALAQAMFSWFDFAADSTIPLGEDDRQALYLVACGYVFGGEGPTIKGTPEGFFLSVGSAKREAFDEYESDEEK